MQYSTSLEFAANVTDFVDGKRTFFLSDRRMDNGTVGDAYETDITGLQVGETHNYLYTLSKENGENPMFSTHLYPGSRRLLHLAVAGPLLLQMKADRQEAFVLCICLQR